MNTKDKLIECFSNIGVLIEPKDNVDLSIFSTHCNLLLLLLK